MTTSNLYPNFQFKIQKNNTNLSGIGKCKVHFKNYRHDVDVLDYYIIEGEYSAFNGVKSDFNCDYMMGQVKNEYKDSFNRLMKITKI